MLSYVWISMQSNSLVSQMESALAKEYELYKVFLKFSKEQKEELEKDEPDIDQVVNLMGEKMSLLKVIQEQEEENTGVKSKWEKEYYTFLEDQRAGVAQKKEALMQLFEQLQSLEETIFDEMQTCQNEVNDKLRSLNKGREVNRAYFKYETGPPRFIDKKK